MRSRLPRGHDDVHRRRLQLRRAHRRRRRAALGRAARRVRRGRAQRVGRHRRPWTAATPPSTGGSSARPRSWPGTSSPRRPTTTRPGVAFLSWLNGHQPAFSMVGGLHSARSLPHLSTLVRLADRAGALEDPELAAERWNGCWPRTASPRRWCRYDRAPPAVAEPGDDQVRGSGHRAAGDRGGGHRRASGCGASRWPRSGWPRPSGWSPIPGCGCPACAAAASSPRPIPTCGRPRWRRTGAPSPRPPRWPRPARPARRRCWCWWPAGCPDGDRDLPGARERARDAVGALVDDAVAAGVTLAIEPMHPIYAADRGVISTLGQALDVAEQFPAAAVGVAGGHLPRLVGPAAGRAAEAGRGRRPDRRLPGLRLDHPAAGRRPAGPRHDGRRAHRLRRDHRCGRATPATPATSRWRSSTRASGTPTRPRSPRARCGASRRTSAPDGSDRSPDQDAVRLLLDLQQRAEQQQLLARRPR